MTLSTSFCFPLKKDHDAITNTNGTKIVTATEQLSIH